MKHPCLFVIATIWIISLPMALARGTMICSTDGSDGHYWLQNRCRHGYVTVDEGRVVAQPGLSRLNPKVKLRKDSCWFATEEGGQYHVVARFRFENNDTMCLDNCGNVNLVKSILENQEKIDSLLCFFAETPGPGGSINLRASFRPEWMVRFSSGDYVATSDGSWASPALPARKPDCRLNKLTKRRHKKKTTRQSNSFPQCETEFMTGRYDYYDENQWTGLIENWVKWRREP